MGTQFAQFGRYSKPESGKDPSFLGKSFPDWPWWHAVKKIQEMRLSGRSISTFSFRLQKPQRFGGLHTSSIARDCCPGGVAKSPQRVIPRQRKLGLGGVRGEYPLFVPRPPPHGRPGFAAFASPVNVVWGLRIQPGKRDHPPNGRHCFPGTSRSSIIAFACLLLIQFKNHIDFCLHVHGLAANRSRCILPLPDCCDRGRRE